MKAPFLKPDLGDSDELLPVPVSPPILVNGHGDRKVLNCEACRVEDGDLVVA
jgi:hypothetical protein